MRAHLLFLVVVAALITPRLIVPLQASFSTKGGVRAMHPLRLVVPGLPFAVGLSRHVVSIM